MKNIQYVLLLVVFFTHVSKAQVSDRIITTGLPFLSIVPDARGAGMGDQGVATSADTYSQFWNPAKYSFHNSDQGFRLVTHLS